MPPGATHGKDVFANIAPRIIRLTAGQAAAEATVALRSPKTETLFWRLSKQAGSINSVGSDLIERFVVRVPAEEITPESAELLVQVSPLTDAAAPAAQHICLLSTPAVVMDRCNFPALLNLPKPIRWSSICTAWAIRTRSEGSVLHLIIPARAMSVQTGTA